MITPRLIPPFIALVLSSFFITPAISQHLEDTPYIPSPEVIKGLTGALDDPYESVTVEALRKLTAWRAAEAADKVKRLLESGTPDGTRVAAFEYFRSLGEQSGPYLNDVLKHLSDSNPIIREQALKVITASGESGESLERIKPLLNDSRGKIRTAAVSAVGAAGPKAVEYQKLLLAALPEAGSADLKIALLRAIHSIGDLPRDQIDTILNCLGDTSGEVRLEAYVVILGNLVAAHQKGEIEDSIFESYWKRTVAAFEKEPIEIKALVIEEGAKDPEVAEFALGSLVKRIQDKNPALSAAGLIGIGEAGEKALPHLDLIVGKMEDLNPDVRAAAIVALRKIGPKAVTPNTERIAMALLDESVFVRNEALLALPLAGDALEGKFPYQFVDVYPGADAPVRATLIEAAAIIGRVKGFDESAIRNTRAAFADEDPDMRKAAAFVLGELGAERGGRFLPELLGLLKDPDPGVRGAAAISLRSFATDDDRKATLRSATAPLLKDKDADVRWAALDALHEFDLGKDSQLTGEVAAMLDDEDQSVRQAAVRTLGSSGPAARPYLVQIVKFFCDDPDIPPFAASQAIMEMSPFSAAEIPSVFYPLYIYSDSMPITRLTAHAASAGSREAQILIHLLGTSPAPASEVLDEDEIDPAIQLLKDAANGPLVHARLKEEIDARIAELSALK